jgi:probable HAF family extracellular repeat protein
MRVEPTTANGRVGSRPFTADIAMGRGGLRRRPPKRDLVDRLTPFGTIGRRRRGRAAVLVGAAVLVAGGCGAAKQSSHNTATRPGPPTTATAAAVTIGPPARLQTPPRRVDLGTLGGAFSSPTAMSGTIVVGVSGTPGDTSSYLGHAFAYDLAAAHPHMVDLGTLGGRFSGANAVDGTWVVGGADSTDGTSHAFAYNLAATRPHMIDLGTAIPDCYADAITGNWVVGTCFPPEHQTESRAFAYDLSGDRSKMIDLGTLGGTTATAFATDGTWAVGYSTTKDGAAHAYAYNLETARPRMIDLGTVGASPWSRADYVQGGRVLGESPPATFVYDLDNPHATIEAIGSLGGAGATPTAADEEWVVGSSATADGSQHAFAYNFAAPHPRMIDLGTLGGPQSAAAAVSGGWVVGTATTADDQNDLFACDLDSAHPHLVDLGEDLGDATAPASTRLVAVGDGWIVGGPSVSRGGLVGHAWAVRIPGW